MTYLDVSGEAAGHPQAAPTCGLAHALAAIGGKWKPTILWELHAAPLQFGALRRRLKTISDKVLTEQLRQLESAGIVRRHKFERGQVTCVEYSLTGSGAQLNAAVHRLAEWGSLHQGLAL